MLPFSITHKAFSAFGVPVCHFNLIFSGLHLDSTCAGAKKVCDVFNEACMSITVAKDVCVRARVVCVVHHHAKMSYVCRHPSFCVCVRERESE